MMLRNEENMEETKGYYQNRELSWLKFNERVLSEANDRNIPLCERLTFASIFQSNLDEFFMVRVGSLYDQMLFDKEKMDNKTNMTAKEQLTHIFKAARDLTRKKDSIYRGLMGKLGDYGIKFVTFNNIEYADAVYLEKYFMESVLPILSPQIVGKKQPFPFMKNKEIYAVALLKSKNSEKIGLIPCTNEVLSRLVPVSSDNNKFMLVEELILHFMPKIFSKYQIKSKSLIRIIRNADIDVDEAVDNEDADYRDSMEKMIKQRKRLCPVKMEYSRVMDEKIIVNLCKELDLKQEQIYYSEAPLDLSFMGEIQDRLRMDKSLFYERHVAKVPDWVNPSRSMMSLIEEKDRLLYYPYESIAPFLRLLNEAGSDSRVVSMKMTLYRVAKNSQIIDALINAAENGKEVVVLVELRARFDEENNIEWSRRLEDAGCRIVYGLDHTKVHSKLCLITYMDNEEIKHITQIGTGNYNEKTAKQYTDLSLMTASKVIGKDAAETFSKMCMEEFIENTVSILVAPKFLKSEVLQLMNDEINIAKSGGQGYIGVKINSLTDKEVIDKLVECSQAGVKVELVVRGICCLTPGIEGVTDNITVKSAVGRFLEHARIYIFGTPERDRIYIASADFMTRNMERRVEIAAPIYDVDIKQRIREIFDIKENRFVKIWTMGADGIYHHEEM